MTDHLGGHPSYVSYAKLSSLSGVGWYLLFTVNLLERRQDTLVRHINVLREAVRKTRRERPFHIDAWMVLPDHMHCVWTLPPGDDAFSNRLKSIKIRFVQAIPHTERRCAVRIAKGDRGIWQRRFWEHAIRDEADYEHHVNYVHWNPVKHDLVKSVADWPFSTFHHYVKVGIFPMEWTNISEVEDKNFGELNEG